MISRTAFCSAQAARMLAARTGPIPSTSRSRSGVFSMTSNTLSPKARTNFLAYTGPTPRIMPDDKYFSMPSAQIRQRGAQEPGLELLAVRAIVDPFARCRDPLARGDRCGVAHQRNEVTMATGFGAQDAETIFGIMIGDSLDQAGQHLLGRWFPRRLHGDCCIIGRSVRDHQACFTLYRDGAP